MTVARSFSLPLHRTHTLFSPVFASVRFAKYSKKQAVGKLAQKLIQRYKTYPAHHENTDLISVVYV